MGKWMPIRKIMAAAIAGAIFWGARQIGLDLGTDDVNEAAAILATVAAGYWVK